MQPDGRRSMPTGSLESQARNRVFPRPMAAEYTSVESAVDQLQRLGSTDPEESIPETASVPHFSAPRRDTGENSKASSARRRLRLEGSHLC